MKSSESETESDCFESAAESLDEDDENPVRSKIKSGPCLRESENEVTKPVADTKDSQHDHDDSNKSLKYRKRPERVKRLTSKSPTRAPPARKTSGNESIFKTDIQPDVLFQDITSNLSRNINKSLNTLQQKSSNVKDLILSSLPVSSVNDNEVFSYDDERPISYNQTEPSNTPGVSNDVHSEGTLPRFDEKTHPIDNNANNAPLINEEIRDGKSDKSNKRKPPDTKKEEEGGEEKVEHTEECYQEGTILKDSVFLPDQKLPKSNIPCIESDQEIKKNQCSEVDKSKSDDEALICSEKTIVSQNSSSLKESPEQTAVIKDSEDTITNEKIIESQTYDNPSDECNESVICADNVVNENLDGVSLTAEKGDGDLECNVEELKTALKNIVKDDVNLSERESKSLKEESMENDPGANEGWDDFDFSDNETETSDVNKCENKESISEVEKINEGEVKMKEASAQEKKELKIEDKENKKDDSRVKNRKEDIETKKKEINSAGEKVKQPLSTSDEGSQLHSLKNKKPEPEQGVLGLKDTSVTKKPETSAVKETNFIKDNQKEQQNADKDGWDWDAWDDEPETVTNAPDSQDLKTTGGSQFVDDNKWMGWDNFGKKQEEKQGNWNLGSWGVNMLLNKATAVTQGISNVLEAGLGAPDPETLARMEKMEREKRRLQGDELETEEPPKENEKKNSLADVNLFPDFGLTNLVAGVTSKIVEHSKIQEIGSKVISGGLDTLETFGKKTMEVLQEGDPGLRNKRALLLGSNKPVLSQVLKEAREKADREHKVVEEKELARKCHFETLFDDFQGLVHLEALEMLSRQCELKLEQMRCGMNSEEQEDFNGILEEVEQLCSLDDYDHELKSSMIDFKTSLKMAVSPLSNEISVNTVIQIYENINKWLQQPIEENSSVLIHQKLVSTLAELTAATVHQFHKAGELLSVKECRKTVEEVDSLSKLTTILCMEINKICDEFTSLVATNCKKELGAEEMRSLKEKISTGVNNSTSYIRQAFNLLIPVLQVGAAV